MTLINKLFILCLIIFSFVINVFSEQAVITKITGKVEVFSENVWKECIPGFVLTGNEKIRTSKRSNCIIIFEKGYELNISAETEFELEKFTEEETVIKLENGKIRSKIKKLSSGEKYGVRTKTGLCSVRGTDFVVEYSDGKTRVEVYEGIISAMEEITGSEVLVHPGEFTIIELNKEPQPPQSIKIEGKILKEAEKLARSEAQTEIFNEISREAVLARANNEIRAAQYYEGKTAIDAAGRRVRMESYIVRDVPTLTDRQFKYVNINERENRFDFGKILFTFSPDSPPIPTDLSIATKDMLSKKGTEKPLWILSEVQSVISNTVDSIIEDATGGDMIYNNADGWWVHKFANYKFYTGEKDAQTGQNILTKRYEIDRDLNTGVTVFKDKNNNVYNSISDFITHTESRPSGDDKYHTREEDTYTDGFKIIKDSYLLDNDGVLQSSSDFAGVDNQQVLQKIYGLNINLVYYSPEFKGPEKKIDLMTSGKLYDWLKWLE